MNSIYSIPVALFLFEKKMAVGVCMIIFAVVLQMNVLLTKRECACASVFVAYGNFFLLLL